jgi:hypothetical protein
MIVLTGENPMKSLKPGSLVVALAIGNLMGCSRVPTKSLDSSDGILAGQEIAESHPEVLPKPSPCIKWDNVPRRLALARRGAFQANSGAGDGGRTRDIDLGKVALYH